ncbi:aryl hydrocarbon receptor [Sarotherodon galilaeus]
MSRRLTKRLSVKEVLAQVSGHEECPEIKIEIEEDVSEVKDNRDFDPDFEETDQSTDGEGEAPEEQAPEETLQSKSGHLLWSSSLLGKGKSPRGRARVKNIKMTPGPTQYAISRVDDIKSSFQLFLPESIEEIILEMTNLEGKHVFGDTWREIDLVDLQAYIGLLILAELWDAESGTPIFRATMSLEQFHVLSRTIRFDNRDTRPVRWRNDKLAAIRNIWDWCGVPTTYNPGPEVTVDERLVPFRDRCSFKVYNPGKPGKCGIKIWLACDTRSSYAWNMQAYMGKPSTERAEEDQGMHVVLDMATSFRGHNITCDNFFTSYALGQELLKRKLTMAGTVKKNKPELPPVLVSTRGREARSSKFAFTDTHALVSYVPKKNTNVILMSMLHKDAAVSTTEDRKPLMIQDYNKNKGAVDCLDKLTGTYTCKQMTARWPVALFHNILNVSAFNAYVVWTAIDPTWNQGKTELGKALVTPLIQRRQHIPASASLVKSVQAPALALPQQGHEQKRKRCELCAPRDNKTRLRCCKCDAYVSKGHSHLSVTCHSCG